MVLEDTYFLMLFMAPVGDHGNIIFYIYSSGFIEEVMDNQAALKIGGLFSLSVNNTSLSN